MPDVDARRCPQRKPGAAGKSPAAGRARRPALDWEKEAGAAGQETRRGRKATGRSAAEAAG
ncbi:hypothetical protein GCM10027203_64080 [Nonomuraea fastidiosa]